MGKFQWLQLQNSHSSLTLMITRVTLLFYMWKMRKEARTSALGKWWKIEKYFQRHANWGGQFNGGGRGGTVGGEQQRSSWEVFAAPGRKGCDVHERKPWLWISGHRTLSATIIPTDVGWISLWWPNSAPWKPCQPPAGQFVPLLHTLLALLLETPDRGSTADISQFDMVTTQHG